MMYAPWCGHCKSMKPKYAKASLATEVPLVALDCTSDAQVICQKHGVKSYPTMKWFNRNYDDSSTLEEYTGSRDATGILDFITRATALDYVRPTPALKQNKQPEPKKQDTKTKTKTPKSSKSSKSKKPVPPTKEEQNLLDGAKNGQLKQVKKALKKKKKTNIEATSKDGYTALIYASAKGHVAIVQYLLKKGASPAAADKDGMNAADFAEQKGHGDILSLLVTTKTTTLLEDAKNGRLHKVKQAIKAGIDVELKSKDGYTSLIYASAKNHLDVVTFLLSRGANAKATDRDGVSAIDYAKKKRFHEVVTLLENHVGKEDEEGDDDFEDVKEEL